ncbi:putative protein transport protein sec73 [Diplodia seriata]|uniref:PH domain-containing protein n=1 Tax=Diplodia seriata TaxID=420778 RepID=A0A0G2ELZ6_9PEZI|nr:putative protein transport protein sec73 [Diplodia seriata]
MPLRGLRPGRSEKDLKRRSTLDPSSIFKREQASRAQSAVDLAPNRGIQSSDGSRPSHFDPRASWAGEPPPSPPVQEHNAQTRRFSMLKFRHASDPQLSQKAKEHAQMAAARDAPPVPAMPAAPAIITTAPTMEPPANPPPKKKTKFPTFRRRLSFEPGVDSSPRNGVSVNSPHHSPDGTYKEAYFISFSIVLLNSDFFNPNNKRKMQKPDYIKNCNGGNASEVNDDVLATLYDNIVYTQFIHIDDEVDLRSLANRRSKKTKIIKNAVQDPVKKAQKEPVDPYTIIFENKLDILRPPIREVMQFEDPYSYKGTAQCIDLKSLHAAFARYGVIQIVSARSRPEAFMSPTTIENPDGAQAGVVEMPVTKVGILWRKDSKKKAARSPWQEWGAVLTRSSLSFFKNASWAKGLIHQHDSHEKAGGAGNPVVFRPPVEEFKPDYAIPMDQCVAASDSSYRKHKYAFVVFAKGGAEEVFLADDEADMNDWLARLNYTAAFETAGIRPRGLIGGSYDGQRNRAIRRLESSQSAKSIQGPTGQVTHTSGKIDNQLAQQIVKARRENIQRKVEEADDRLGAAVKQLDSRLRDARHLQVMAPIQPRTREHVMHAAGRMAAKLKWIRIEIVRMKAHRDILIMDMDEEKKIAIDAKRAKELESIPPWFNKTPITKITFHEWQARHFWIRYY